MEIYYNNSNFIKKRIFTLLNKIYIFYSLLINTSNNKRKIQKNNSFQNNINSGKNQINLREKNKIKSKAKLKSTNKIYFSFIKSYNASKCNFNNFYKNYLLLLISICFIFLPIYKSKIISFKILNLMSQIKLRIDGMGEEYILSTEYKGVMPDVILINGEEKTDISKKYNLANEINNITMKWSEPINDSSQMFFQLLNIKEIDLTDFDASLITNMECQFWSCFSLTSIKFKNFNTSSVKNMDSLFYNCKKLISLDLSSFDTSKVTYMDYMFYGCELLTSLNVSKFDTSKVISMMQMFSDCISLISLDLNNFNTSSVKNMASMFFNCENLISLNIDKLDTSKVIYMSGMFEFCQSLKSINLKNFDTSSVKSMQSMFQYCISLTSLDLSSFNTSLVVDMDNMFSDCISLISLNLKSFDTSKVTSMEFMFYNCESLISLEIINFNISLVSNIISMFSDCKSLVSLNLSNFETSQISNNENLDEMFLGIYDQFVYCIINETKISNLILGQLSNFINNCANECFEKQKKIILDKKQCVFNCPDDTYEFNDICYETCPNGTKISPFNDHLCEINCPNYYNYNRTECIDNIPEGYYINDSNSKYINKCNIKCKKCTLESIKENNLCIVCNTNNGYYPKYNDIEINSLFIDCFNIAPDGYILNKEKEYYQLYDSDNSNNCLKDWNINAFFKGNCNSDSSKSSNSLIKDEIIKNIREDIINNNINISENSYLTIKDNDIIYQITSTKNENNKKDSNVSSMILGDCEDILKEQYKIDKNKSLIILKIDYYKPDSLIPIIGYEIFHPDTKIKLNLTYCNNTSIDLNIPVSLDENNLFKYDPNSEYYTDECNPYTTKDGTDILLNDRHYEYNSNNMSICENNCTLKEYEKDSKKVICECNLKYEQIVISEIVNDTNILSYNFTNKEQNNMITMKCVYTLFTKDGISSNIANYILVFFTIFFMFSGVYFYKCSYFKLEDNIREILEAKEENATNKKKFKKKKNSKKKKNKFGKIRNENIKNTIAIDTNNFPKSFSKFELKNNNNNEITIFHKNKFSNSKLTIHNIQYYNDYEINSFSYEEALKCDNRTYFSYYMSLIKVKHPILFSFYPIKDYNSLIIKIDIFLLSFSLYYIFNAFFFDEKTIHKIYEDEGVYNFIYSIPFISYSFFLSHTLIIVIKYFSLSERNIIEIKNENDFQKASDKADKIKRFLIIKYICFFIIGLLFLIFFWYYLSSFGAVYQNTQIYLVKNTLISFGFSLIYPFIINLIPAIFRIYSLKERKENRKCFFKISKVIQLI